MTATSDQAGADGRTRIVEVGEKPETAREAIAECVAHDHAGRGRAPGRRHEARANPIETAKIAGVIGRQARRRDLLPFCHPIRVTGADVDVEPDAASGTIPRRRRPCARSTGPASRWRR